MQLALNLTVTRLDRSPLLRLVYSYLVALRTNLQQLATVLLI